MDLEASHYVLVGNSGSGKTSFAIKLAQFWKRSRKVKVKSTYIVNAGNSDEDIPTGCRYLEWGDFARCISNENNKVEYSKEAGDEKKEASRSPVIENCVIIFEDCIKINASNKDAMRISLNYSARRSNVFLLIITHSLVGTQLMTCLQYIPRVLFFGGGLNVSRSFKVLKDYGGLGPELKDKGANILLGTCNRGYRPLLLDLINQQMIQLSDTGRSQDILLGGDESRESKNEETKQMAVKTILKSPSKLEQFREGFDRYFAGGSMEAERKLGHFIVSNSHQLLKTKGNPCDMSVQLVKSKSRKACRISLLDFCSTCASPSAIADKKCRGLFKLLAERMEFPRFLVKNESLRKVYNQANHN